MIYLPQMRAEFDDVFDWYKDAGGNTPTAPAELFQLYRWLYVIGLSIQHVYGHSKIEDLSKPYSVVELGTGAGATAILMAKGFQDGNKHCFFDATCSVLTVDNGHAIDASITRRRIAGANAEFGLDIQFREADDLETLAGVPDFSVDLLFTDAEHGYKDVTGALDLGLIKLVSMGRYVGHDYDFNDIGVPLALDEWRHKNRDKVFGWSPTDSLWWMVKK